jgi:hypothetical protein
VLFLQRFFMPEIVIVRLGMPGRGEMKRFEKKQQLEG